MGHYLGWPAFYTHYPAPPHWPCANDGLWTTRFVHSAADDGARFDYIGGDRGAWLRNGDAGTEPWLGASIGADGDGGGGVPASASVCSGDVPAGAAWDSAMVAIVRGFLVDTQRDELTFFKYGDSLRHGPWRPATASLRLLTPLSTIKAERAGMDSYTHNPAFVHSTAWHWPDHRSICPSYTYHPGQCSDIAVGRGGGCPRPNATRGGGFVRLQLRMDGFTSIGPAAAGGGGAAWGARACAARMNCSDAAAASASFVTKPFAVTKPSRLFVNVASVNGGKLLVEVLDSSSGLPRQGFAAADSVAVVGDRKRFAVAWGKTDGAAAAAPPPPASRGWARTGVVGAGAVSLRFLLFGDVQLFSFWLAEV